ncbi:hypothetical protein CVT26_009036 [Gymnopilus dilepis]|uniref:Uncharacterized protein n=1 Tax=Gymnopilus dilepis TaxID=231916 RepID=A0A409WCQ6_9AGAR|nr:hypothetical protein CVT26_009036 [Gymnopilus dilepis]
MRLYLSLDHTATHVEFYRQLSQEISPPATRTITSTNVTSRVVDSLVNTRPSHRQCVTRSEPALWDTLKIGRAFPIILPAFVLLRIIVDLVKKAQDVDAKCNDLVERITFMLRHLAALQNIKFLPATQRVIDCVNHVSKDTAASIADDRKQGRLARRLSLTNSNKFAACARSINNRCSDLLMNFRIHQTVQVTILTGAIPVDEEDMATREFVQPHVGCVQVLVQDLERVGQSTRQQHSAVDKLGVIQLRTNMADQQIRARLESILHVNNQLSPNGGPKNHALEFSAEQKFVCVQYEHTNHTNGPQACSFHSATFNVKWKHFPCRSTDVPCQHENHRSQYHCDYPYSAFSLLKLKPRVHDNVMAWVLTKETNVEKSSSHHNYYVGSGGALKSRRTHCSSLLAPFTRNRPIILRHHFARSARAFGVHADLKSSSFDLGDALTLSKGGLPCYKPASPYELHGMVCVGPIISDIQMHRPCTNFRSEATQGLQVIPKAIPDPPVWDNMTLTDWHRDYFNGKVAIFTTMRVHS